MNIDIKDVLTLDDDHKYVVVSKVAYQDEIYFYLVDTSISDESIKEGNEIQKILRLNKENGKFIEFNDENLIKELIPLFFKETMKFMEEEKSTNNG